MQQTYIPAKKKKRLFLMALLLFFLTMLIIVICSLAWLWQYLARYEANTPNASLQRYADWLKAGDYDAIYASSGFQANRFTKKEDYIRYIKSTFKGEQSTATFIKKPSQTPNSMLYDMYLEGKRAGSLEVTPSAPGSDYRWTARAQLPCIEKFTITAPAHVKVMVNGEELGSDVSSNNEPVKYYNGVQQQELIPKQIRYDVEGLLLPPVVTAQKQNGEPCKVIKESATKIIVSVPVSKEVQKQHEELLEKAAKTYAAYITMDAGFSELGQYLFDKTEFYNAIKDFYNGWYIPHDSFECRNVKLSDLFEYSDNDYTGSISFDYVIKKGTKEYVYPSSYQLSFIKINSQWKLINIVTR